MFAMTGTKTMTNVEAVGALLENDEFKERLRSTVDYIKNDTVLSKMYAAAETVEDIYQMFKDKCKIKLEEFKALCSNIMEYFNQPKVELSDEIMDIVTGGGFWSWITENVGAIVSGVVGAVVGGVLGAFAGFALGGPVGAIFGGICGALGFGLGFFGAYKACENDRKKK